MCNVVKHIDVHTTKLHSKLQWLTTWILSLDSVPIVDVLRKVPEAVHLEGAMLSDVVMLTRKGLPAEAAPLLMVAMS